MTGLRRDQVRGLKVGTGEITPTELDSSVYAASGTITEIDPDDAASAGVATTVARGDHQHAWPCAAPSTLARTSTNTEGSSGDGARADHGHSTANLAWGVIARQILTSSSTGFDTDEATDFALDNVVVDSSRLYRVHLATPWSTDAGSRWLINFHVDATLTDRLWDINEQGGNNDGYLSSSILWLPTSGTKDLTVELDELVGTSTLTFPAASTATRMFWVSDEGPRS